MEGNHPDHDADDHGYQNAHTADRGSSNPARDARFLP
jgi:hypothetical protein